MEKNQMKIIMGNNQIWKQLIYMYTNNLKSADVLKGKQRILGTFNDMND